MLIGRQIESSCPKKFATHKAGKKLSISTVLDKEETPDDYKPILFCRGLHQSVLPDPKISEAEKLHFLLFLADIDSLDNQSGVTIPVFISLTFVYIIIFQQPLI